MLEACSIGPNMINAPWLDKPSKITESELTALETNYESMLSTIQNDTFGGIMPPKTSRYKCNEPQPNRYSKTPYRNNHNSKISVFVDPMLDTSSNNNNNDNLLSQDIFAEDNHSDFNDDSNTFMNAAINLSVQRVRQQLNMNEDSPSVSPIRRPQLNDESVIDINLQSMTSTMLMNESNDDDTKNDLSLPFISPSSTTMNESNLSHSLPPPQRQLFVPESISPPMFQPNLSPRRSRSAQPTHSQSSNSNFAFSSVPPPFNQQSPFVHPFNRHRSAMASMARSATHSSFLTQIQTHFGAPDSFTSSMMVTPTNAAADNAQSNSSSFVINHMPNNNQMNSFRQIPPAPQRRPPHAPNRRNVRNVRHRRHEPLDFSHQSNSSGFPSSFQMEQSTLDEVGTIPQSGIEFSMPPNLNMPQNGDNLSGTPSNVEVRTHSVSLEAPRLIRRNRNRRNDTSSLDF